MSKYIITLLTLIFVFFLVGSGCTVFQDTNSLTNEILSKPLNETSGILHDAFYFSVTDIQTFLDSNQGPLKDYYEDGIPAAQMIWEASNTARQMINPRVLLVLMELRSGIITNSEFEKKNIPVLFGITDEKYRKFAEETSRWTFGDGKNKELLSTFTAYGLRKQFEVIADELNTIEFCLRFSEEYSSCIEDFLFVNFFSEPVAIERIQDEICGKQSECFFSVQVGNNTYPPLTAQTIALYEILAQIAPDRTRWVLWASREEGSFHTLFIEWFGDSLFNTVKQ